MTTPKRIHGSIRRSPVAWAWEFLRRNPHYRKGHRWWKEGKDRASHLPQEVSDYLHNALLKTGVWQQRFTPWVKSVVESGRPFATPLLFAENNGSWTLLNSDAGVISPDEVVSMRSYEAPPSAELYLLLLADRLLDPMEFCLNRWLDPEVSSEVIGEDVLAETFDVCAITTPNSLEVDSPEASALRSLGLLAPIDLHGRIEIAAHLEHVFLTSAPPSGTNSPAATAARRRAKLKFEFDPLAPVAPQLAKAEEELERLRKSIAAAPGERLGELKDVKVPDQGGVFTSYLRILDLLPPDDHVLNKEQLYRSLCSDPSLRSFTSKSVEKALAQAKLLRDGGYRSLAFSMPSRS